MRQSLPLHTYLCSIDSATARCDDHYCFNRASEPPEALLRIHHWILDYGLYLMAEMLSRPSSSIRSVKPVTSPEPMARNSIHHVLQS